MDGYEMRGKQSCLLYDKITIILLLETVDIVPLLRRVLEPALAAPIHGHFAVVLNPQLN